MSMLYNSALCILFILALPKLLWDYLFRGKYRKSLALRITPKIPTDVRSPLIWLHAVSMGETKALATLVPHIRNSYPKAYIYVTTTTETGQAEAQKKIPDADGIGYLPFDFSWIMKKFVRQLNPTLLLLVEGDFWFHMIREVKKRGGKIGVVNGKLTKKSLQRYLRAGFLCRSLFSPIDHLCVQGEKYHQRFLQLGIASEKLAVTGNIKFDIPPAPSPDCKLLQQELSLASDDKVITIGSTHQGEEDLLYRSLLPVLTKYPRIKILIAPRHPERFAAVKRLINHPRVQIVEKMGVLSQCYALSQIAIVGGSFVQGIGGHDIFEPVKIGIPTLYGPYMAGQIDLDQQVAASGGGVKLPARDLPRLVEKLLTDPSFHTAMSAKGKSLAQKLAGASLQTWKEINSKIPLEKNSLPHYN